MHKTKYIAQIEPWIDQEEIDAVVDVMKSGWITEAKKTAELENMIAAFVGTKYTSVLANGTVTLFAGLAALGIKSGDEVIVPDFTMVASPNAIALTGATPVFVDIDKETLCLDLDDVERKITSRTKAIMPVLLNGRFPDMDRLLRISKKYKLFVLEDAAQALGCYYNKKHLGSFGDIGSFSFSTPKVITTAQGGALVTNNKKLYERIVQIKDFGRIDRMTQDHDEVGYNFKFTDIQAAIGIVQMKKLQWRLQRKKEMYLLYKKELEGIEGIRWIRTDLAQTSPWFIDIFVPDPVALQIYLKSKNIGTRLFYPAIHTTKPYKKKKGTFPNSYWVSTHGLWLPSSTFLSDDDIIMVGKEIRMFYKV
jgi:perosamine synthetase